MGIREATLQGLKNRNPAGSEVRHSGQERLCDRRAHVGECRWEDIAQDRNEDPILSLPQLHIGARRTVQGIPPSFGQEQCDLVRQAALRV